MKFGKLDTRKPEDKKFLLTGIILLICSIIFTILAFHFVDDPLGERKALYKINNQKLQEELKRQRQEMNLPITPISPSPIAYIER